MRATCPECRGEGRIAVNQCPYELVDHETLGAIREAGVMEKHGLLPVAGGMLDQTQAWQDGREFIEGEQARVKRGRENT